ncbi:MAG: LPS assembly lipoprotein LptE [Planctomycetota bacterium]
MNYRRNSILLFCLAMVICGGGCAGYNVGNQFLHRSDIRTVHVGFFESESYRRFLGQRFTEAVTKQIELDTPLTITEPALADSFIQGRLVREQKRVLTENRGDEPRALQLDWQLEVTWVDRAGVPLMQRQLLKLDRDVDFVPEGGQSVSTAQQELINRMAREIVGQMEMPW